MINAIAVLTLVEGVSNTRKLARALASGALSLTSSGTELQRQLLLPASRIRPYREVLSRAVNTHELILALDAASTTAEHVLKPQSIVEVAWTFPADVPSPIRTTGAVACEVIDSSLTALLIVGYAVTISASAGGLGSLVIGALCTAAERGVTLTAILHRDVDPNTLLKSWRVGAPKPTFFTWPRGQDAKASIHAKLLIADRNDAFVTSANLTYHGFEANLEVGVRVAGFPASQIADGFQKLIATGHLVPWP